MLIDITLSITPDMVVDAQGNEQKALVGHLGTHFDVMDKEFSLSYCECEGIVFDVRHIKNREIEIEDIALHRIHEHMFVAFYSGFIEETTYGSANYFTNHPQLSQQLIQALCDKKIAIIGVDFAGIRRGRQHPIQDQYCADHGVFVVENLCNLQCILAYRDTFVASTYPMRYQGMSGLPCRVVARLDN